MKYLRSKSIPGAFFLALIAAALSFSIKGCITPTTPQTTTQQIAFVRVALAAVYNTSSSLSQANRLSIKQLHMIRERGKEAERALFIADVALTDHKDEASALEALRAAQRILRELEGITKEASQ